MNSRGLPIAAIMALAGCAHSTSVVLLPDEDGGHGQIAIAKPGSAGETLVSEPNSRATLGGPQPVIRTLGAKGLSANEAQLLGGLPPAAKSFTLYFIEGTTDMTAQSAPMLAQIRAEIAKRPGAEVQVTGHTDTVGSESDNDSLSKRRAEEILSLLASKGFDRAIMTAVGRGERELAQPTSDNVSNPVNRRVEVIVR